MAQKTVTANGNAQIDTAQQKFGTGSGLFDGAGDYLNLNGESDFSFGASDFTVDLWIRLNAKDKQQVLYDSRPFGTSGVYVAIAIFATNELFLYVNSGIRITGTTKLTTNTWYHIALSRSGTSTKLFLDGTQEGSTYTDSNSYLNGANRPIIGIDAVDVTSSPVDGWLDEIRVSNGVARWTANFTPPSSAYSTDANTVLLLHCDGVDGSTTFTDSSLLNFFLTLTDTLSMSDNIKKSFASIKSDTLTISGNIIKGIGKIISDILSFLALTLIDSYSESNQDAYNQMYGGYIERFGQSFTNTNQIILDSCKFYLKKTGNPPGTAVAKLYAHSGTYGVNSRPTGSPLATSDNFDVSSLTTSLQLITFNFSGANRITLSASTYYCITIEYTTGDTNNCILAGYDLLSSSHSGNMFDFITSWSALSSDLIFYVYGERGENLIINKGFSVLLSETLNLSENIIKGIGKNINDTLNLTDNIQKAITFIKSEIITLSDNIQKAFAVIKSEIITLSEDFAKNFAKFLTLTDTITMSESISTLKSLFISLTDTLNLSDNIKKAYATVKSETITLSDNIRKFINGFEQIWIKGLRTVSTIFTKRSKPSTAFTKRTKPSTSWTKRDKPWD